ncbi:MAG: serine/threonine protein kinase [Deltaproteobacteria bacterium]|nr:serine/threonine protein kinase [Deltaproteobacteria bacterium]
MKSCTHCQRLFDDDAGFCPIDGSALAPTAQVAVAADPEDRRIGHLVCEGRYEIRRKVADGGMGRVYQAIDRSTQTSVALKVLHQDVARDAVALERFKREYALSAELPHHHIAEVRDFQKTEDDSYAIAMEYLEGEELRMYLKREKKLAPALVVRILSQLAIGLAQPHQLKLVHRDIKPDNVFLCHTDEGAIVKLLDFGSVRDNSEGAKKLTIIGTTIGSPFYMSPEQAQGLPGLDHRADVWSLAAIAYECLTGTVPFGGSTGPQILLAILGKEPDPPSTVDPSVPTTVDDVMSDALAKEAATRIGTVGELADRFGAAYGLQGSHVDWAYLPEQRLKDVIDQAMATLMMAGPSRPGMLDPDATGPMVGQRLAPGNAFHDEDFVMGVPDSPPIALYIGAAILALLVIAAIVLLVIALV